MIMIIIIIIVIIIINIYLFLQSSGIEYYYSKGKLNIRYKITVLKLICMVHWKGEKRKTSR